MTVYPGQIGRDGKRYPLDQVAGAPAPVRPLDPSDLGSAAALDAGINSFNIPTVALGDARWGDPVNFKARYGVTGDGVTDDHDDIATGDADLAVSGCTGIFPKGTYKVGSTLVKSPKTLWRGPWTNPVNGTPGALLRYTGEAQLIKVAGPLSGARGGIQGVHLSYGGGLGAATTAVGIRFEADIVDQTVDDVFAFGFYNGVEVDTSKAVYLRRCYMSGIVNDGVYLNASTDCWLIHTQTEGNHAGVEAVNGSDTLQLVNSRPQGSGEANIIVSDSNWFSMVGGFCDTGNLGAAGNRYGAHIKNTKYARFMGVHFYTNGTIAQIVIEAETGKSTLDTVISGCTFNGTLGDDCIRILTSPGTISRVAITGNASDSASVPILTIQAPSGGGSVSGVSLVGNVAPSGSPGVVGKENCPLDYIAIGNTPITMNSQNDQGLHTALVRSGVNLTLSATQTVDGVALSVGDRVLCTAQTTASQNGLWVVQSGTWTRPDDWAHATVFTNAQTVTSTRGSAHQAKTFISTVAGSLTVDSTSATFAELVNASRHYESKNLSGSTTAAAVSTNATGVSISGSDTASTVSFTTAASISADTSVVTVTFSAAFAATPNGVTLTPRNGASAAALAFATTVATGAVTIALHNPPAGATAMQFDLVVIG